MAGRCNEDTSDTGTLYKTKVFSWTPNSLTHRSHKWMLLHYNPQDRIDKMQAPTRSEVFPTCPSAGYYQLHPHPPQKRKSCSRDGTFHLNSYLLNNAAGLHSTWETWEITTSVKLGQLHCCRKKPCTCQQAFSGPSLPSSPQTQIHFRAQWIRGLWWLHVSGTLQYDL